MKREPFLLPLLSALTLTGCSALQSPGGRITLLVLVPALLIGIGLYLLRRRTPSGDRSRGPRYPDYDERD